MRGPTVGIIIFPKDRRPCRRPVLLCSHPCPCRAPAPKAGRLASGGGADVPAPSSARLDWGGGGGGERPCRRRGRSAL
eukprot:5657593-Pyramimonas_sp.AAC.1